MSAEFAGLSPEAANLHQVLIQKGTDEAFTQKQMMALAGLTDTKQLMPMAQELMNQHLLQVVQQGSEIAFKAINVADAQKIKSMSQDEALVYQVIEAAGRQGAWSKVIKERTKLHQAVVSRCIKSLENQRYIKLIKSVHHSTRKIYMLYHLQPSNDVSGGVWWSDGELDVEFIDMIMLVIWKYVAHCSFPTAFSSESASKPQVYPAHEKSLPNVGDILDFVLNSKVMKDGVHLGLTHVRSLCEVLVYDDKLERHDGGMTYKATWPSIAEYMAGNEFVEKLDGFTEAPCGQCPVFSICEPDGPVNPAECEYYDEWLRDGV
ncbi:DNA-directed RNA polymerase III subunit RPC6 [Trichomonascus vanleenenianus]|uniref:DNA-directed RNA polymerase III subunit C34 n=1 Tax=Trichomonascus vanleenenianus TaxID=2268995 RepID=UPI003ECB33F0